MCAGTRKRGSKSLSYIVAFLPKNYQFKYTIKVWKTFPNKTIKWYVASDEWRPLKQLAEQFKDNIVLGTGVLGHTRLDPGSYERAILDSELLSRCDELIITGGSSLASLPPCEPLACLCSSRASDHVRATHASGSFSADRRRIQLDPPFSKRRDTFIWLPERTQSLFLNCCCCYLNTLLKINY